MVKGRAQGGCVYPRLGLFQGIPNNRRCPPSEGTGWPELGNGGWVALGTAPQRAPPPSGTPHRAALAQQEAELLSTGKHPPHTHTDTRHITPNFKGIGGSGRPGYHGSASYCLCDLGRVAYLLSTPQCPHLENGGSNTTHLSRTVERITPVFPYMVPGSR